MNVLLPLDMSAKSEQVIPLMLAEAPPDTPFTILRIIRPVLTSVMDDSMFLGPGTVVLGSGKEQAKVEEFKAKADIKARYLGVAG